MTWIRVESNAGADRKWSVLGKSCGLSGDECFGKVVRLWGSLADHQPDGDLSDVPDEKIEEWAHWTGKPGKFAKAYRAQCTSDGLVKAWADINGKLMARKAADRERKAQERLRIVRKVSA